MSNSTTGSKLAESLRRAKDTKNADESPVKTPAKTDEATTTAAASKPAETQPTATKPATKPAPKKPASPKPVAKKTAAKPDAQEAEKIQPMPFSRRTWPDQFWPLKTL